jgi:hypothetical protein
LLRQKDWGCPADAGQPFSLPAICYTSVMIRKLPLLLFAALIACGPAGDEPDPGGVSAEDAHALDEAAAKLDDQKPPSESKD